MSRNTAIIGILLSLCIAIALLGLLAGFVPQREGPELRRRASITVIQLRPDDMPAPILGASAGWSVRTMVAPPGRGLPPDAGGNAVAKEQWVSFVGDEVSLVTVSGFVSVETDNTPVPMAPLLPLDGVPGPVPLWVSPPPDYGEALNTDGRPLRWATAHMESACGPDRLVMPPPLEKVFALMPIQPFSAEGTFVRARRYRPLVESFARRFGLSPALVFAIIQTESNFSPVLVSSRSAMGLMQLLPSTAGGEVHRFLHGTSAQVTFTDLSNPETNIRYGTAYLHLLLNRHLADVMNSQSREYCAVAAYNMGPNRFLRLFSEDRAQAIEMLNAMTPEQVLQRLTTQLPVFETRAFVAKVTQRRSEFVSF